MNFNKIKVNWLPRCATNTAFCHHKIRMLHTFGSLIITNITPSWEIVGVGRLFILVKILVKYLNFDPKPHGGYKRRQHQRSSPVSSTTGPWIQWKSSHFEFCNISTLMS